MALSPLMGERSDLRINNQHDRWGCNGRYADFVLRICEHGHSRHGRNSVAWKYRVGVLVYYTPGIG